MEKFFSIDSCFGFQIVATTIAASYGGTVLIIPNKDEVNEYNVEAEKIFAYMAPLYRHVEIVPFAKRHEMAAKSRDLVTEIRERRLPEEDWERFVTTRLTPTNPNISYNISKPAGILVPGKIDSDGLSGATAQEQSVSPVVFEFLKNEGIKWVLGQHFSKDKDLAKVMKLANAFDMYVPGKNENKGVLGLRGVEHIKLLPLIENTIVGVHTPGSLLWLEFATHPEIPQLVVYNEKISEPWDRLAELYRKHGMHVYAVRFNNSTSNEELTAKVKEAWKMLKITMH